MSWVEDSTPLKRFKKNRSGYLTQFQKETSRNASKHGRNAGTAVFVQKGSTLKVMEEFNIQGNQSSFYKYCPGTFGYVKKAQPASIRRTPIMYIDWHIQLMSMDTSLQICHQDDVPSRGYWHHIVLQR